MAEQASKPIRHMGSVTDPNVEEGLPAPEAMGEMPPLVPPPPPTAQAQLGPPPTPTPSSGSSTSADESPDSRPWRRTGHPLRDRLLSSSAPGADLPRRPNEEKGGAPLGKDRRGVRDAVSRELDELAGAGHSVPSEPMVIAGTQLSPRTLLGFITLIGFAGFASLFMLLIQLAPKDHALPPPLQFNAALPASLGQTASVPSAATTAATAAAPETTSAPAEPKPGPWRIGTASTGQRVLRGTVGKEPFLRAIQSAGLSKSEAYRVYGALKEHKNLDRCRPRDEFVALIEGTDKRVIAFEYVVSREEVYQAREKNGALVGAQLDMQVRKQRVQGSFTIDSSFSTAATGAGFNPSLGVALNQALDGHTSVEEFQSGDRLRIIAQEVTILGDFYRYAGVEAIEYVPKDGSPIRIYYNAERKRYYDARGRSPGEGGWRRPVKGAPVTSKFNPNRLHPILKKRMPHNGTDFGAPTGTPIGASGPGKITKLGNYGANGNFIAIAHAGGIETGYSHLSRFEPGLKVGDTVKRLQPIGYVGSTGRSTGPHLHFSAKKNGAFIDPESLQLDALTVLSQSDRSRFQPIQEKYDTQLDAIPLPQALDLTPLPVAPLSPSAQTLTAVPTALPAAPQPLVPSAPQSLPTLPQVATAAALTQPVNSAAPSPPRPGGSLFLSDDELIKLQSATSDGEVE